MNDEKLQQPEQIWSKWEKTLVDFSEKEFKKIINKMGRDICLVWV